MEGVDVCPDDDTPLVAELPPESDDEAGEIIVYELDEWTTEQRRELELRLNAEGIDHQWETSPDASQDEGFEPTDLLIGEDDEPVVDAMLDEIEQAQALPEAGDESDEDTYEVISALYVASDRLKDDPADLPLAGEFFDAADALSNTGQPFGFDDEVWRRIQSLSGELVESLEGDADDMVVARQARTLRDILFSYI